MRRIEFDLGEELLLGAGDRVLRHAEAAAFGHRLDDRRQGDGQNAFAAAVEDLVARGAQSVALQDAFGDELVAAAPQGLVGSAGVDVAHGAKQARHLGLAEAAASQALDQVEDDRSAGIVGVHRAGDVIPHGSQVHSPDLTLEGFGHAPRHLLGFLISQQVFGTPALQAQGQAVQDDNLDRAQVGDAPRLATHTRARFDDDVWKEARIRCGDLDGLESRVGRSGLRQGSARGTGVGAHVTRDRAFGACADPGALRSLVRDPWGKVPPVLG